MKSLRWLAAVPLFLFLARGSDACVEALTLSQMVQKTDAAVLGTITDVHSVLFVPDGEGRMIYTVVTIQGEDLYTGLPRTIDAAFVGGTHKGESMLVTSMPAPSEYRIGNEVLIFSGKVEGWGPEIDRCVYASMGGIFRTVDTRKGLVLLGKGKGTAVERNIRLSDLRTGIVSALQSKSAGTGGER